MAGTFRRQVNDGILNEAGALFARYGFAQTSVQAIADAVGMSKAGLLHHFPSKEALRDAVTTRAIAMQVEVVEQAGGLPVGPARDRLALEIFVDQALYGPGLVAFALSFVATMDAGALAWGPENVNNRVFQAFGVDADTPTERLIRITGALASLSILVLVAHQAGRSAAWRTYVIATAYDALGHPTA